MRVENLTLAFGISRYTPGVYRLRKKNAMPYRSEILTTGEYYHVFNRSIAQYRIFDNPRNCKRFVQSMRYYQTSEPGARFSKLWKSLESEKGNSLDIAAPLAAATSERLVDIIGYCLMPTHVHFILKQLKDDGISRFMANIQNSYSRYFNLKYTRNGPLWGGRFKNILIDSHEYFAHLTCYLHLNPVSAGSAKRPEEWEYSSYREYCGKVSPEEKICSYEELLDMSCEEYRRFVEDRIEDQKELAEIRHLLLELE